MNVCITVPDAHIIEKSMPLLQTPLSLLYNSSEKQFDLKYKSPLVNSVPSWHRGAIDEKWILFFEKNEKEKYGDRERVT